MLKRGKSYVGKLQVSFKSIKQKHQRSFQKHGTLIGELFYRGALIALANTIFGAQGFRADLV